MKGKKASGWVKDRQTEIEGKRARETGRELKGEEGREIQRERERWGRGGRGQR